MLTLACQLAHDDNANASQLWSKSLHTVFTHIYPLSKSWVYKYTAYTAFKYPTMEPQK